MAERDSSRGNSKSRPVLGDVTNRVDERRVFGKEKRVDFNDKDGVKRIRVSPRFCAEINSSKGNIMPVISDENKNPNLQSLGNRNATSGSCSVDVDLSCDGSDCLKGERIFMESSEVHGEKDGVTDILCTEGREGKNVLVDSSDDAVILSQTVSNNVVGDCGKIDGSEDASSPSLIVGKISSQDDTEADGCSELPSSKGNTSLGISAVVMENSWPRIKLSLGETVADSLQGTSKISDKENDPNSVDLGRIHALKANVELHDRFAANTSRSANNCITGKENKILEGTQSDNINIDHSEMDDDQNADNLILSQSSSFDPESFSAFGADRPTKEADCAYVCGGTESIRGCSCSFCTKAAQLWLDLHHQDIKGRLSAIRKSQKEAGILGERSCKNKVAEKHSAERSTGASKMESHLMNQWRCLFEGMAGIWEEEGNRLEANLQSLSELKNKCKADLGLIDSKPKPSEDDQH